jgi:hypothetical protein
MLDAFAMAGMGLVSIILFNQMIHQLESFRLKYSRSSGILFSESYISLPLISFEVTSQKVRIG